MDFFDFSLLTQTYQDLKLIFSFLVPFKWIILPFLAYLVFLVVLQTLLFFRQSKFRSEIEWEIFEIRIPREIKKGPKAMDQFFAGLWTLINMPVSWKEKYIDGEVTLWHSFEILGKDSKVHFFVKTPKKLRHLVESMLYAQYPDIEISSAEDYTTEFPNTFGELERSGYDIFGIEAKLKNAAPFPINTYMMFESQAGDERIVDPISQMMEFISRSRPEERFWIQLIVRPAKPGWEKESEKIINDLRQKSIFTLPGQQQTMPVPLPTPSQQEIMKSISFKIAKRGFEVLIRLAYIAPKDIFNKNAWKNMFSYFNQMSSSMNYFALNPRAITGAPWWKWPFFFTGRRTRARKENLLFRYKDRYIPEETAVGRLVDPKGGPDSEFTSSISILNSEELATLYHPPTDAVLTAPAMERVESKKVSPPGYIPY